MTSTEGALGVPVHCGWTCVGVGDERAAVAATIRDVASVAGVSPSTASRALTSSPAVSAETRARVQRAAERLGYRANRAARGLITGRTHNLGIVVPDLGNPVFPGIVKGIQARARESDYDVFLADSDEDPPAEAKLVRALARQVDGIVLCSPRMPAQLLAEILAEVTVVLVNRQIADTPSVTFDDADGVRQAVAHLHALGHRRIAWAGGPPDSYSHHQRLRGLRAVAERFGLDLVEVGEFAPRFASGLAAADLALAAGATAVLAYNDVMALGILRRLADRGVGVPERLSVVGVDDIPFAAMAHPPLTTVAVPGERAGRAAVDLLLDLLAATDGSVPSHRMLATQLVIRSTSGPAHSGGARA